MPRKKKYTLVWLRDEAGQKYLGYRYASEGKRVPDWDYIDSVELIEFLDQNAEIRNNHQFCGSHKALYDFMLEHGWSVDVIDEFFFKLAQRGGLDVLCGLSD